MNRMELINKIEEKLSFLATRIELRVGLNLLDLNIHSENFYRDLLNLIFNWNLRNLNAEQKNTPGIDLIDDSKKIIVQISSTATKEKVNKSLSRNLSAYKGYNFKFISISKDAKDIRGKTFENPYGLIFSSKDDILDIASILSVVNDLDINKLEEVYSFIKSELISEPDLEKMESNLATIIDIISKEDWSQGVPDIEKIPFDIEAKILYNQLENIRSIIDEYKIFSPRIGKIYSDYDKQGANKSLSVLNSIRTEYSELSKVESPEQCFFSIVDKVIGIIKDSSNYRHIVKEELEMSVQILVVDAFIRCKIFKNPSGNTDVNP
jgi:hypothetical protein